MKNKPNIWVISPGLNCMPNLRAVHTQLTMLRLALRSQLALKQLISIPNQKVLDAAHKNETELWCLQRHRLFEKRAKTKKSANKKPNRKLLRRTARPTSKHRRKRPLMYFTASHSLYVVKSFVSVGITPPRGCASHSCSPLTNLICSSSSYSEP